MKAKVIRDVYVRGEQKKVGDIVDLPHQEYHEMRTANYIEAHEEPEAVQAVVPPVPPAPVIVPEADSGKKKG